MKVLILCSGNSSRWIDTIPEDLPEDLPKVKQLAPVYNNIPLIQHTINNIKELITEDISIVSNDLIFAECGNLVIPEKYKYTAETLQSTENLWEGRTIILLGDVLFSRNALRQIKNINYNLTFFGRFSESKVTNKKHGEIFGLTFDEWGSTQLKSIVFGALQHEWFYHGNKLDNIRLWEVYKYWSGIEDEKVYQNYRPERFFQILDYTDDFDTYEEYKQLKSILKYIKIEE